MVLATITDAAMVAALEWGLFLIVKRT